VQRALDEPRMTRRTPRACALPRARRSLIGLVPAVLPFVLLPAGAPLAATGASASEATLPRIDDLRRDAERVRRERKPLLLFFSTPGCPYCLEVRRSYLAPRAAAGEAAEVLVREVDVTGTRTFIGLDGSALREAAFAERLGVRLVPVVRLVDERLAPLAAPLVGLNEAGFYESYLAAAIEEATAKLRGRA
jgi:hypothetical protein